jgi:hypothetical protein
MASDFALLLVAVAFSVYSLCHYLAISASIQHYYIKSEICKYLTACVLLGGSNINKTHLF